MVMIKSRQRRLGAFLRPAAIHIAAWLVLAVSGAASLAQIPAAAPDAAKLQPGLAAGYYYALYKDVGEFRPMAHHDGAPVMQLNHPPRSTGNVLTSRSSEGVAADLKGYIRLDRAGPWRFRILSNDGVRVTLGDKQILEDPRVHADQTADSAPVEIKEPGWYELRIQYFQRKGTWALTLYWQPPGGEPEIVPARALAHLKD
jgi:hypothetical protein